MRRAAAGLALGIAAMACLPRPEPPRPCPDAPVVIHVANESWETMVLYVEGAVRARLGSVTSFRAETFQLPAAVAGGGRSLRLVAIPVGAAGGVRTEPFTAHPGQRVAWRVTQPLRQAPATLRVDDPVCEGEETPADSAAASPATDSASVPRAERRR